MGVPVKRSLVVLEDSALTGLAVNAAIVREFPFLKSVLGVSAANTGCRCKADSRGRVVLTAAKRTLAGMSMAKKNRLKELLNTRQVKVIYKEASGRVVSHVF